MEKYFKFTSLKTGEATLTNGFWANRVNDYMSIIENLEGALLSEDNAARMLNFGIAAGEVEGKFFMNEWSDGDCYKFIEGCMNQYAVTRDERILAVVNKYIPWIEAAQEDDGYIGTQTLLTEQERWTDTENHELYNMGHLLTAACVHHDVTGEKRLLNVAIRAADYLWETFSTRDFALCHFGFNPSQIMGLVELYQLTKEPKYLELADIFTHMRGENPEIGGDCNQNRVALREETQPIGHAVTGAYLYAGAVDVYAHTGEAKLIEAVERIWQDLIKRRIYITGGVGPQYVGVSDRGDPIYESFAAEYDLPHRVAYNETCANIAVAMWAKRMLQVTNKAEYGDWMETILFNAGISGSNLHMTRYFYANPLAHRANHHIEPSFGQYSHVPNERFFTFDCWCCPPQLLRTFTGMPKWIYSVADKAVSINLFAGAKLDTVLPCGSPVNIDMQTNYPWDETVTIEVLDAPQGGLSLNYRIPSWCEGATLNGEAIAKGMHVLEVAKGDVLTLVLPMQPRLYAANPMLEQANGMLAVKRGPVVYCLEGSDIEEGYTIDDLAIPTNVSFKELAIDELPHNMVGLSAELIHRPKGDTLYFPMTEDAEQRVNVRFIPYFAWANREEQDMSVWLPRA
ncbi:glycoside hydrolase family 127 protein [Aliagarivorans marinus]|uniref:glycoside hydrolase family 127 protein n=1 Tax=Aliagarivorans marinus TaxID=561965 RepID=UPI000424E9C7|nr:beta-L-arabinofuranosidase domain-containing protein [Aliagarivorans marinus]